jgi:hypothetical protein
MRPYRDVATLAVAQILCFLLLTHLEPEFFLLHLYQSIIYMAIILQLFYLHERWAYMIGMLASAAWLMLAFATGLLGGAARQLFRLGKGEWPNNSVSFLAALTGLFAVLMIVFCARHWKREYSGLGKWRVTFLVSFVVVAVYHLTLVTWFWEMIPKPAAVK